ncbi:MAG: tetratricopeptide repeat-containing sensor histidine kinase [Bacteroidota bacterium]
MKQQLTSLPDDTTKVRLLHRLSHEHWYIDGLQAEAYARQGIALAQKLDDALGLAKLYNVLGVTYMLRGDNLNALKFYDESERIYLEIGLKEEDLDGVLNNKSIAYGNVGLYNESIKILLRTLKINEQEHRKKYLIYNLVNLGVQYMHINKDSLALEYFQRPNKIIHEIDLTVAERETLLTNIYENIGSVYIELNAFDSALHYLNKSLAISTKNGEKGRAASCYAHFANIAMKEKKYTDAIQFLQKGIALYEESKNEPGANKLRISVGIALQHLRRYDEAIAIIKQSYQKAKAMDFQPDVSVASFGLSENFAAIGRFDSAYKYLSIHGKVSSDLFNQAKEREIMSMQAGYDLSKQKDLNELLQKANSNQRIILILLLVITVIILVWLYFFRRSYLREKRIRLLLNSKNEEITTALHDLRRLQSQLVHNEKMASLGLLVAGVAHEINNPINFISGGVQALENEIHWLEHDKPASEGRDLKNIKELLEAMKKGVVRTTDIISALQIFGSSDTRSQNLININECIQSTLAILQSKFKDKIKLTTDLQNPLYVKGNATQINQVLLNIIDNAIYAAEAKEHAGEIFIRTFSENANINVLIKDNGQGIPPEISQKIFDPFFTTKPVGKGTGLGLSISHNIIQEHRGSINVKSKVGQGTEFTIVLPAANDQV